ncbi:MAG TPA: hypothetical protein ENJ82_06725 [Bacteroidetes bacterium]|nr:hypothetical protein [Bacteroidota bacterium]
MKKLFILVLICTLFSIVKAQKNDPDPWFSGLIEKAVNETLVGEFHHFRCLKAGTQDIREELWLVQHCPLAVAGKEHFGGESIRLSLDVKHQSAKLAGQAAFQTFGHLDCQVDFLLEDEAHVKVAVLLEYKEKEPTGDDMDSWQRLPVEVLRQKEEALARCIHSYLRQFSFKFVSHE